MQTDLLRRWQQGSGGAASGGSSIRQQDDCRPQLRTRMPSGKPGKFSTSWVVVSWPPATRWKEGRCQQWVSWPATCTEARPHGV